LKKINYLKRKHLPIKKILIFLIKKLFKNVIIGFINNRKRYRIVEMNDDVRNIYRLIFIDKRLIVESFPRDL
jgi:hypothetical protein